MMHFKKRQVSVQSPRLQKVTISLHNEAQKPNIEKMQTYKISCPEEISFNNGWISEDELSKLAQEQIKSGYGEYLKRVLEGL